ncbi:MAG: hypothetical protein IJU50_09530 [Lachnospiraceae bacterium]|nr:hypothetical protein [Lachnospiraceae bacterium]
MDRNEDERRIIRHRNRMRAQIVSYAVLIILLAIVVLGILLGARVIISVISSHREAQEEAEIEEQEETPSGVIAQPDIMPEEEEPQEETGNERDEEILGVIRTMSLEDKVAQLFFLTPEQLTGYTQVTQAGDATKEALEKHPVGGLFYNSSNFTSESQLEEMLSGTVNMSPRYRLFFATEELGGAEHSQLSKAGLMDAKPSPEQIAASGDANAAYDAGTSIGATMKNLGFTLNLGPCADLLVSDSSYIKEISYGADLGSASNLLQSMVKGLSDGGIDSCLKFFPGAGSVAENPAEGMAQSNRTSDEILSEELSLYRTGLESGARFVLAGTASYPEVIGDNTPACLSDKVMEDMLKEELSFQGVLLAGPLNDKSITEYYDAGQAAVLAFNAGADMLLMPENFEEAYEALLAAAQEGNVSEARLEDALLRIYRIKY